MEHIKAVLTFIKKECSEENTCYECPLNAKNGICLLSDTPNSWPVDEIIEAFNERTK